MFEQESEEVISENEGLKRALKDVLSELKKSGGKQTVSIPSLDRLVEVGCHAVFSLLGHLHSYVLTSCTQTCFGGTVSAAAVPRRQLQLRRIAFFDVKPVV